MTTNDFQCTCDFSVRFSATNSHSGSVRVFLLFSPYITVQKIRWWVPNCLILCLITVVTVCSSPIKLEWFTALPLFASTCFTKISISLFSETPIILMLCILAGELLQSNMYHISYTEYKTVTLKNCGYSTCWITCVIVNIKTIDLKHLKQVQRSIFLLNSIIF